MNAFNKPVDLNEWAYMNIKMRILENELKPGTQLNIEELSKELNISRTPIRDALLRLRQNGLVLALSRVGYFVCGISKEDYENIFEIRNLIESYAAEQFAKNITEEEIKTLFRLNQHCKKMAENEDIKGYNNYDTKLHQLIIKSLKNKKMEEIYENLRDMIYMTRALTSVDNIKLSILEHEEFLMAIKDRDSVRAREKMQAHIESIRDRVRQVVGFVEDNGKGI